MGKPVEKKRKKKGRPSLLDLQKRSLRLQKQQEEQQQQKRGQNPSPNPYVRFPNSTPSRRSTRRSTEPEGDAEDGEDDEEEGSGKRREKKLKLVLRLHQNNGIISKSDNAQEGHSDSESSGPESKGDGDTPRKEKKIDAVGSDGSGREKVKLESPRLNIWGFTNIWFSRIRILYSPCPGLRIFFGAIFKGSGHHSAGIPWISPSTRAIFPFPLTRKTDNPPILPHQSTRSLSEI